jgi:HSP20 family molecular chaperone IbpA
MPAASGELESVLWMPTTDILTRENDLVVRAELPGVRPEDVDISVTDDVLVIRGHRVQDESTEKAGYVMRESFRGDFERRVSLPKGIDPETIRADFSHGMLEVTVPKAAALPESRTHHVPIAAPPQVSSEQAQPAQTAPEQAQPLQGGSVPEVGQSSGQ